MTFFFSILFVLMVFWRPQEWLVPALEGWPILDVVVAAMVISFIVEIKSGKIKVPRNHVPKALLGLFLATLMSHIAHTYFDGIVGTIGITWKFPLVSFLLFCSFDRISRVRAFAIVLVAMACLMAVHTFLQVKRGYGFAGSAPMYVGGIGNRPAHVRTLFFGIFEDPNDLAQILATAIPLVLALPRGMGCLRAVACGALITTLVAAIYTTHSRGGVVGLAGALASVFLMLLRPRWASVAGIGMALVSLVLCFFSGSHLDDSAHDRVVFWGQANQLFKASPINVLFGIGYGMLIEHIEAGHAAHNAYVLCYSELGLLGYWFWFSLLIGGVVGCVRTRRALARPQTQDQRYLRRFAGLAIAAMAGFAVSSYFLTRAYVYPFFFLFALLNAVPLIAQKLLPPDHPPLVIPKRDFFLFGGVGSIISIIYIYISILILNSVFYG